MLTIIIVIIFIYNNIQNIKISNNRYQIYITTIQHLKSNHYDKCLNMPNYSTSESTYHSNKIL